MFELTLCSLFTILPDYLFRRYVQDRRFGRDINIFTVWYELRWGITGCLILTISLITVVFYYHPSTTNAGSFFRTVTILPEGSGRVSEIYVKNNQKMKAGDKLFSLDSSVQQAAVETATQKLGEVEASMALAKTELAAATGVVDQAKGALQQVEDELKLRVDLNTKNSSVVSGRELRQLENRRDSQKGALAATEANLQTVEVKISTLLPAQMSSANAALHQAEVNLEKTTIYAGVDGELTQFVLEVGDYVSPLLRPAGILIPDQYSNSIFRAGFNQITAQVIKPGMVAEITCVSKPFAVIPMVVTAVQSSIAAGQFRPTDQLIDAQDRARPGTLSVSMEPLYPEQASDVPPGSKCIANVYTNNHHILEHEELSMGRFLFLHLVDTVGLVHALILRIQALLLPVQTLVLGGH